MIESRRDREADMIEMPRPTSAPLVLATGICLFAVGWITSMAFVVVGGVLLATGLGQWIHSMFPGRGHWSEPRVAPAERAAPVGTTDVRVEPLRPGMPGYRLRLPTKVHPVSAGMKGGLVGGLAMALSAVAYGYLSGHGIWYPINLLAGMILPGIERMKEAEIETYDPRLLALGVAIHLAISMVVGLIYGALMPTLPNLWKPIAWGALLMPLLWTAASYLSLDSFNPRIRDLVDWPWFIASQFVFGMIAAVTFMRFEARSPILAGALGGIAGGLLMTVPALIWGYLSGHGPWYPLNLLSAMVRRHPDEVSVPVLEAYHPEWLGAGITVHAGFSVAFGLAFALVLPWMPTIPGPLAWGGLVMPLLWTALSYGLMGIVNPALQTRIDWPWFIVSQFVFGLVAAWVVVRSEQVEVPAAKRVERGQAW